MDRGRESGDTPPMNSEVTLRRLATRDAEGVLAAFQSSDDMGSQGQVRTLPDAQAYVSRLLDPANSSVPWAICDKRDALVGLVVVSVDTANRTGWFWYWLHAAHRGHGLASRAAATVAGWALGEGGLERLELGHRANNPASRGVALAAGFIQEGLEREKFLVDGERVDVFTYGRLRSDPAPNTSGLPLTL